MNVIAVITGKLIFLIVAAAVGVVQWLLDQLKKKNADKENPLSQRPPRRAIQTPSGESEQERLRRFLEALGVPQPPGGPQPPPQPGTPPARRPIPPPVRATRPSQKPATPPPVRSRVPTKSTPPPLRAPVQRPLPARDEMAYAGRLEEPATSIEKISSEFQSMSVAVTMQPIEALGTPTALVGTQSAPATVVRRANAPIIETLRVALHTPADLRTAFVAMEVLGTPRGLQK